MTPKPHPITAPQIPGSLGDMQSFLSHPDVAFHSLAIYKPNCQFSAFTCNGIAEVGAELPQ